MHAVHHLVGHLVVRVVTPPREDVGFFKRLGAQAVLGFFERRKAEAHASPQLAPQTIRNRAVHAVRIDSLDGVVALFVNVLVPDRDPKMTAGRHQIASASPDREIATTSRRVADSTAAVINAILPRLFRPDESGSRCPPPPPAHPVTFPHPPV